MSRKQPKRRAGNMAYAAIAGFFIVVIVGGVGFGVASADSYDDVERAGAFGFSAETHTATASAETYVTQAASDETPYYEQSALAATTPRDIDNGMLMIDEMERIEQERLVAENAAALKRMAATKAMQGVETPAEQVAGAAPEPGTIEYSLPAVDWSVGRDAFIAEWTSRIDAYLEGSPLAGYGSVFAEAAWDNGVDPRWSPAISNTESGKGSVCFRSCNAWGWGNGGWGDWNTAIQDHVAGLAAGYGYSITPEAAQRYCPPTWESWYEKTLNEMAQI